MKRFGRGLVAALASGLAGAVSTAGAAGLEAVCPVDFAGVPLGEAVHELAVRLEVPYLVDASVSGETLSTRVRFFAAHLSGRQALRWTARSVGLDAILVRGTMLVAEPERLPVSWRAAGTADGPAAEQAGAAARWQAARARQADISWVDTPLSVVARDVSGRFGVDLIFHPDILADQDLVQLDAPAANLETIRVALEEQLKATLSFVDGAWWAEPAVQTATQPASGPAAGTPHADAVGQPPAPTRPPEIGGQEAVAPDEVLARRVRVGGPAQDWGAIGRQLGTAGGVECRIDSAGRGVLAVEAEGPLADVLEAARILENWSWTLTPPPAAGKPVLSIRTGAT